MIANGPEPTSDHVRNSVAIKGKTGMMRTSPNVRSSPRLCKTAD